MNCEKCNAKIKKGAKYCTQCGNKINDDGVTRTVIVGETSNNYSNNPNNKTLAIVSIILGIISFVVGFFFIPLPIIGLILGIINKEKCTEKTIGIVLNSIVLAISIIVWILLFVFAFKFSDEKFDTFNDLIDNYDEVVDEEILGEEDGNLSNWQLYSNMRRDNLSFDKSIEGYYRKLSGDKNYFILKNGEFYLYNDENNREDNFFFGTYKTFSINDLDIDKKVIDATILRSKGKITLNDFYYVVFTPSKAIFNAENDKSLIEKNKEWKSIWILVDHADEGIEAQVVNINTDKFESYVKVNE